MKILIYGAGSFGSFFAERLTEAGHQVSLLARGQRLKDLQEHGVVIENSSTGEQTVTRVPVVEMLHEDDYYDLVMVPMRKNQAMEILPDLAVNRKVPTFLFMMNNAEGQERLIQALGRERVMIGFPLPGGGREGDLIRMLPVDDKKKYTIPVGEVDGSITECTRQVAEALDSMRGYKVQIRRDMDKWLKCHVALLMPGLVPALYAADTDLERMERTRDALVLGTRGMKESLRALRRSGVIVMPWSLLEWIPEPLMVYFLKLLTKEEEMEISGVGHALAARDEMKFLTDEFLDLIRPSGTPTPVIDELYRYYDPETPPLPDGSSKLQVNWKGVWGALLGAAALAGLIVWLV